jgi:hypothetical protein
VKTYNFKARFAGAVEQGRKRQTIRAVGKRPAPAVGDMIRLYTGMRTKQCRRLCDVRVRAVLDIRIAPTGRIYTSGIELDSIERVCLAVNDGFSSVKDFIEFFRVTHGLPFKGRLIMWHPQKHKSTRLRLATPGRPIKEKI